MVASLAWSIVPIAPSATTTRSVRADRSVLITDHLKSLRHNFPSQAYSGSDTQGVNPTKKADHVGCRDGLRRAWGGGQSSSSTTSADSHPRSLSPGSKIGRAHV